ncbi:UDP-N-acetylhexosamine pyrophosphorylase [Trachymyrmex septentrionalis]|uniref:UDP-N-acetylglucosamine diphosphorylase n=1 Tax=Trachymyrmex septentrionalis TaxID=34720 RepID=A0A195ERE2_9HYME|nr:PREDICTED: UDP-N-acetylhexosamine pyrophosphorylase [Trachymyrmex septentrionalis]KYN30825.1 UDP-N-acetylhexosamine pyrophosphorylase [Trachymyrmex septentrionalis]
MERLKKKLSEYDQEHLLRFWEELVDEDRNQLENDIDELDLQEVTAYFKKAVESSQTIAQNTLDDKIQPIDQTKIASVKTSTEEELNTYKERGLKEIAQGCVAVLLLAGGQGTRLGVTYPKGMYDVALPSHKTLFQLQAERILCLQSMAQQQYGKHGEITWYILTSEATHDATVEYLNKRNYFGLKEKNVKTFKQGMLPCFTFDGKIILDAKHRVSKAPDGNGGLYRALKAQGILDDMEQRGIRSVHAHSVDNIVVKVADPIFIGYCLLSETDCGVKVIEKSSPSEAVGIVCKVENHYQIVEYSEITKETAELRHVNGQLIYNAANICNHYFTVDFLKDIAHLYEKDLLLHVAKKKISYVNDDGERIVPKIPNGIKIEKFVFDVFPFAKNFAVWQGTREEEFSPLKNSNSVGQDCPSTARIDLLNLHKKWLLKAGAKQVGDDVEISPLLSYAGENLCQIVKGQSFVGPQVLE